MCLNSKKTRVHEMESFLENLKKDVQCSLCNDTLTEPKILSCFHTFCKLCIKRDAELIEQVNVFKCPKCSTQTPVPEECCLDNLKPNNFYTRISDVLNFALKEKVCSVCESHPTASWYCCECDRLMCDKCVKNHVVFIDAHKVINLNELNVEDLQLKLKREDDCTSHVGRRFEVFCEDCDALLCLLCLKQAHTEHKLLSLNAFASLKREILSRHLQELEQLAFNEQEIQEQKNIASLIKQNGEKAIKEVKDRTKQIIEILQKNEEELLQQIKNKMEIANRNLNIIHHFPAVKEHINNVMQRATASEMINIRETECSEDFILNPIQEISEVVFVPNEKLMEQVVIGLGDIQTEINSKTDHTMSTIQVEFEPEALRQEKLVLITKTSTGEVSNNEGDVVEVKISPEDDVIQERKYVKGEGKIIEVQFIAKVAGPLTAEVQVNGNHVSNSPLVMNVKPQQMGITGEFKMKYVNSGSHTLTGIAVNKDNSKLAVAYESCSCIHVFNTNGDHLLKFGRKGSGERQLLQPEGLVFLNETDLVIADNRNYRICIMNTATGKLIKTFGKFGRSDGDFNDSYGVDVDIDSNIIACDYHNNRVQVFTRNGDYQYQFGLTKEDNFGPVSAVTHGGRFYVSDHNNHVIHVFEKKDGVPTKTSTIGSKGSGDGQLNTPWGLAIDNDHNLLVCDRGNNRIQKFTLDGHFVGKTHDKLKDPRYVTVLNDGQILVTTFRSGLFIVNRVSKTEDVGQGLRSGRTRRR